MLTGMYAPVASAVPLRTLVDIEGMRDNQLVGYGLVVGLNGTGDGQQIRYTGQTIANVLKQFGITLPENQNLLTRNVAAVMVSATFPAGYVKGQKIDVTVSSMGDARSLRGGTLMLTSLRGVDGQVYAIAQGNVVVPGIQAQGNSGSSISVNSTGAGRIPNGATIENEIPTDFESGPNVRLSLRRPNFQTAVNIVKTINRALGSKVASSHGETIVDVAAPMDPTSRDEFVARIDSLDVTAGDGTPRAVFNSRTGTVVIADGMTVKPVAVSHGSLKVVISESTQVSQPNPFGGGRTVTAPATSINVEQDRAHTFLWPKSVKLQTIVDTINGMGATPDDLMAILQALDEAGALNGELIVI
ncbi:flagellar basal body P-ring protein FlgI [Burkholderia ubonensis]|uniref:flagellar basal body P-ring protein FlgI n=1 Tax=Burkholderia ubonensis TaxID=101571 RepID=UPI001E541216|nr:flagellar basal body P-ring protein FlgI [Burkholderia ubonensis]